MSVAQEDTTSSLNANPGDYWNNHGAEIKSSSGAIEVSTDLSTKPAISEVTISSSGRQELPEDVCRRIIACFYLYGTPLAYEDNLVFWTDDAVIPMFISRSEALSLCLCEEADLEEDVNGMLSTFNQSKSHFRLFSWQDFRRYADVSLTVEELKSFHETIWLPFCKNITHPNTVFTSNKRIFPNPYKRPMEHNIAAKGLCLLYLQRQQVVHAIYRVLKLEKNHLLQAVRVAGSKDLTNVPVWWCPNIHDIAVMIGTMKYGYLTWDKICCDDTFSLSLPAVRHHIISTFLNNNNDTYDKYNNNINNLKKLILNHIITNNIEKDMWLDSVSVLLPDLKEYEGRLVNILSELLENAPVENYCRVRPCGTNASTSARNYKNRYERELSEIAIDDLSGGLSHTISSVSNSDGNMSSPPPMPLIIYLNSTKTKRQIVLQEAIKSS